MSRKSLKNCKHLVELVEAAALPALQLLAEAAPFEFLKPLDWQLSGPDFRQAATAAMMKLPRDSVGKADQEAVRILQLADWRSEDLVAFATQTPVFQRSTQADWDPQLDVLSRLIWFWTCLPTVFDQLETIFLAHHYHGYKKYKPFKVRDGEHRPFVWTEAIGQQLQEQVGALLALEDEARRHCEVIHFAMEETGEDPTGAAKLLHYVVVYHPGKMKLLRQMKDRRRDLLPFYPALEATLVYDASDNRIMVLADKMATRIALAECFSAIGFDRPLSAEPLEELTYDLSPFRHPVNLLAPRIPGLIIQQAWVTAMTLSLGHSSHKLTLTMNDDADLWKEADQHFGTTNPLIRARSIYEVRLSFVLRFDGQDTTQALDMVITYKTCSLWSLHDPKLRSVGEDLLVALSVMQRVEPPQEGLSPGQFLAELELLDQPGDTVEGFLLRELKLDSRQLEAQGLIRKKDFGNVITRLLDDAEEAGLVYQRLAVKNDSRRTWAVDPLTGQELDLSEGDLRRYAINQVWLRQRLTERLSAQLIGMPREPATQEPFFLGYYPFGEQDIPISLATRLWQDQQAEAMDVEMRKQALGVGIVLTTTSRHYPTFLGASRVVPIAALLAAHPEGIQLDLSRIEPEFRRWRQLGAVADQPRLIKEAHGAILVGPWPSSWTLSKPEQIAAVQVLVNAWHSGKKKCSNDEVLGHYEGARRLPERFRDDPAWPTYIRSATGGQRSRFWELNIGQPDYAITSNQGAA